MLHRLTMCVFDFFCGAFHSFALYYRSIAAAVAARKGRRRMKRIRHLLGRWTDVSIWVKSILLMGIMLVSLWTLVILATQQLRGFSAESDVIMNEYMDITGFMNAFSAENVALETYCPRFVFQSDNFLQSTYLTSTFSSSLYKGRFFESAITPWTAACETQPFAFCRSKGALPLPPSAETVS